MLLPPVRPSAAGSTFSRPRANMYRQTQLWNASAAANSEVRNSHCAACDSRLLPPRPNSSPGPCAAAAATTWLSPAWAAMAQLTRGVDDGDHAQRQVGGHRDGPPRVAGFLGQHRRLLEPDEPEHGDDGQHAERAEPGRGQRRRGQGGEAEVPAGRVGEPGDGLGDDDGDLGAQQHAQDLAGDVDPQQPQHRDDRPGAQRPRPPRRVDAQVGGGLAGGVRAERPVQADLQEASRTAARPARRPRRWCGPGRGR